MANSKINLILASASPRRKELLEYLGIPFVIMTSNADENIQETNPSKFCEQLALLKGETVLEQIKGDNPSNALIVSADTIVVLDGKIFNKPAHEDEARDFLHQLSGRTHSVYTAVAVKLLFDGHESGFSFVDEARVSFEHITPELMQRYLATGDSLDKAGAYGIQGPSLTFISRVEGSYATVVGFPLSRFVVECEKFIKKKFPGEASWFDYFHS